MAVPTLKCQVAFASNPLASSPTWTDISALCSRDGFTYSRGRASELDQIQAGRATVVLQSINREFEPGYSGSPYYPNVTPGHPFRLLATWSGVDYPLFQGFVESFKPGGTTSEGAPATILTASDAVGSYFSRVRVGNEVLLSTTYITSGAGPYTTSGTMPGNRKAIFACASLTSGQSITINVSGTTRGGSAQNENMTLTYPTAVVLSTNRYGTVTTISQVSSTGAVNGYPYTVTIDNTFPSERTGSAIISLLKAISWTNYNVPSGQSSVQAYNVAGGAALQSIASASESEQGFIYVANNGEFRFRDRLYRLAQPVAATFSNRASGAEIPYESQEIDYGSDRIYNEVTMQRTGGTQVFVRDTASITKYFQRTYNKTNLNNVDDTDIGYAAAWLLNRYKEPQVRFTSLTLRGDLQESAWPTILGSELDTRYLVKYYQPNAPAAATPLSQEVMVENITVTGRRGDWTIKLGLSLGQTNYWVVGTSKLNTQTLIAY
jgi:hypothetical protein